MTNRVYEEIKCDGHDVVIIDNSSSQEFVPQTGVVHQLGHDNIEFGGMIQWLMANEELIKEYDFVGFLNNDTYGYNKSHIDALHEFLTPEIGISHWGLYSTDPHAGALSYDNGEDVREVSFVENVCPYYNINLIREFRNYFPLHKHGCIDIVISNKSLALGYKNIVINKTPFHHIRSGVRKLTGSYDRYMHEYNYATAEWNNMLRGKGLI
jgi:hypothetical protein